MRACIIIQMRRKFTIFHKNRKFLIYFLILHLAICNITYLDIPFLIV